MEPLQTEQSTCSRWRLVGPIALACAAAACGPKPQAGTARPPGAGQTATASPSASPASTPAAAEADPPNPVAPDCEALALAWRSEWVGDDENPDPELLAELEERSRRFPCELRLDLDGDHTDERIFITSAGPERTVGIGVEWSDGHRTLLGAGHRVALQPGLEDEDSPIELSDFGWLVHWKPAPLRDGVFEVRVLHNLVRFRAPDALGDGIEVSGSDAAAIIYFDGAEWRWIHLGF